MMDDFTTTTSDDPGIRDAFEYARTEESAGRRDSAVTAYRKAVKAGCVEAMIHLGIILIDGSPEEKSEALELFELARRSGCSSGTRNLGYCNAIGLGCARNKEKAAELYTEAAEAGNARAQCNIGVLYEYGHGVELDLVRAAEWYRRSAESGCTRGMTNYGRVLRDGTGTECDPVLAAEWFSRSGSPRAKRYLAQMLIEGKDIPGDMKKAIMLLEESSVTDSRSMVILGDLVLREDRERAISLFRNAASKGNADATDRLTELGVPLPDISPRTRRRSSSR